jgi:signal transduction histidine kinase
MEVGVQAEMKRLFKVDARMLLSLGRESIKDHTTALVELIKNSYDADATNVDIEFGSNTPQKGGDFIRITDDGTGMNSKDVDDKWLRIGFSEKRTRTKSAKGRRETGEKGVGRLSADRLGAVLELRSKAARAPAVAIAVDWDHFDVEGTELGAIGVRDLVNAAPSRPHKAQNHPTSTEILIKRLRQDWSEEDLGRLETELSTLVSPRAHPDGFKIWVKGLNRREFAEVAAASTQSATLHLAGRFDRNGRLSYELSERPKKKGGARHTLKTGKVNWDQLRGSEALSTYDAGALEIDLGFFPRTAASLSEDLNLSDLRSFLDKNAGIRIYRDGIRVKPYGDPEHPEGDWLGLASRKNKNPAGRARKSFRVAANQVVGAVYIGRDTNKSLADSAAREGLIQGHAYAVLKAATYACISLLEGAYHETSSPTPPPGGSTTDALPRVVNEIKDTLRSVSKDLNTSGSTPEKTIRESVSRLRAVAEKVERAEKQIEELASQSIIYRGLATVGISSAVFGHETESALTQARISTSLLKRRLSAKSVNVQSCLQEATSAEDAIARVELWGQFALTRIKKDKRKKTKVNISNLVSSLAEELRPLFAAKQIALDTHIDDGIELRAFAMDIESVALNLLTNGYHAAGLRTKDRKVAIALSRISKEKLIKLTVRDSGPGISKEHLPRIWSPLFSTKSDSRGTPIGTGLGLSIVQSVVREMNAKTNVLAQGDLGGATFEILFPAS